MVSTSSHNTPLVIEMETLMVIWTETLSETQSKKSAGMRCDHKWHIFLYTHDW